jgi:hypothetical protein
VEVEAAAGLIRAAQAAEAAEIQKVEAERAAEVLRATVEATHAAVAEFEASPTPAPAGGDGGDATAKTFGEVTESITVDDGTSNSLQLTSLQSAHFEIAAAKAPLYRFALKLPVRILRDLR